MIVQKLMIIFNYLKEATMCKQFVCLTAVILLLGLGFTMNVTSASELKINFQSAGAPIPEGYLPEYGEIFFEHDNGWSYGWNQNITSGARDRNNANAPDQRYDTLNHFRGAIWEIEVPNGTYNLYFVCGDPSYTDQTNNIDVEGTFLEDPDGPVGTGFDFDEFEVTVEVNDGRLTIQPGEGQDRPTLRVRIFWAPHSWRLLTGPLPPRRSPYPLRSWALSSSGRCSPIR